MSRERERFESIERAKKCGLSEDDAIRLRRIALTLNRWFERECGDSFQTGNANVSYAIERDGEDGDGLPYEVHHLAQWEV